MVPSGQVMQLVLLTRLPTVLSLVPTITIVQLLAIILVMSPCVTVMLMMLSSIAMMVERREKRARAIKSETAY